MGIKNLSKFIATHAPDAVSQLDVKKLKGKVIAIDASQTIYQYVLAIRSNGPVGDDLKDKEGNITSHLHAILYKTLTIMKNGSKPVFVFDGEPPAIKQKTIEKRHKEKIRHKKIEEDSDEDTDKRKKAKTKTFTITDEIEKECMILLDLMGVPYVKAPQEADSQCAYMADNDIVDYVMSDDMDLLTFGTPILLRTIRQSSKTVTKYNLERILDDLDVTYDQFIDICILLESDYCPSIRGLGIKKILNLVKKYESIEGILEWIEDNEPKGMCVSNEFKKSYDTTREYFKNPKVNKKVKMRWNEPDTLRVFNYLKKKDFNPNTLKTRITNLWRLWCNIFIRDTKERNRKLKHDIFPGIKFDPPAQKQYKIQFPDNDSDDINISIYRK
jgi:flap endonuclease-1